MYLLIQLHQEPTGTMNRDSSKMINLHSIQWQSWAPPSASVPCCDGAQLKCRLTFNVLSVLMTRDKGHQPRSIIFKPYLKTK